MKGMRSTAALVMTAGLALSLTACGGIAEAGTDGGSYGATINMPKKVGGMSCGGGVDGKNAMYLAWKVSNDTDEPMSLVKVEAGPGQNVVTKAGGLGGDNAVPFTGGSLDDVKDDEVLAWHLSYGKLRGKLAPVPVTDPVRIEPGTSVTAAVFGTPKTDGELAGFQGMSITVEQDGMTRTETADVAMWTATKGMDDEACKRAPERVPGT